MSLVELRKVFCWFGYHDWVFIERLNGWVIGCGRGCGLEEESTDEYWGVYIP
jgi:hypothetical protein